MRYEHLELDVSTAALAWLQGVLADHELPSKSPQREEMRNFRNEIAARLQRTDVDPHCPKNFEQIDWLTC